MTEAIDSRSENRTAIGRSWHSIAADDHPEVEKWLRVIENGVLSFLRILYLVPFSKVNRSIQCGLMNLWYGWCSVWFMIPLIKSHTTYFGPFFDVIYILNIETEPYEEFLVCPFCASFIGFGAFPSISLSSIFLIKCIYTQRSIITIINRITATSAR